MTSLNKVVQNSFLYSFSSIILRASSIIFFPLFSLYLTKADYGILSISQSIYIILVLLAGLELNKALTRFIFNKNNHKQAQDNKLIYTSLSISFSFGCLIVLFMTFIGQYFLGPILKDISYYPYVFVYTLCIPLNTVVDTCRVYLKARHKGVQVFILDTSFYSFNILLNLFFIIILKWDVLGLIFGTFLNIVIFLIILIFVFYRKFSFSFDRSIALKFLKYSTPLIPYAILNILFESIDKFSLNANLGSEKSGIYYLALTFAAIFSAVKESVINALTPWIFENIENKNELYLRNVFNVIFVGLGIIAVGIAWFSKEVLIILSSNPEFVQASFYIPFAVMSLYFIFLGQLFNIKSFYFAKKNHFLFMATLTGILINLLVCHYFIPYYGIYGAVAGRIFGSAILTAVIVYISFSETEKRNIYHLPVLLTTLVCIFGFCLFPLFDNNSLYFLIIKSLLYLIILLSFSFYLNKKFDFFAILKSKFSSIKK
ncbi:MAG: hypothetical protein CL824_03705 [Crocinitomicaceae bacterium]|nr:hypothetical protein [Crocinitomicaceae bacterium]